MKLIELLDAVHASVELSSGSELKDACKLIIRAQDLTGGEKDTLRAAFKNGPLFDGDIPSKSARDGLVGAGFMAKVLVNGEEGFNACTYKGAELYRIFKAASKQEKE